MENIDYHARMTCSANFLYHSRALKESCWTPLTALARARGRVSGSYSIATRPVEEQGARLQVRRQRKEGDEMFVSDDRKCLSADKKYLSGDGKCLSEDGKCV